MIDYKELKRRLNLNLQLQLERNNCNFDQKPSISDYPSLQPKYPDYTHVDLCKYFSSNILNLINDKEKLQSWADIVIPELMKCDLISLRENLDLSDNDKLVVTKLYFETQISYYKILARRAIGDFLVGENIESEDYSHKNVYTPLAISEDDINTQLKNDLKLFSDNLRDKDTLDKLESLINYMRSNLCDKDVYKSIGISEENNTQIGNETKLFPDCSRDKNSLGRFESLIDSLLGHPCDKNVNKSLTINESDINTQIIKELKILSDYSRDKDNLDELESIRNSLLGFPCDCDYEDIPDHFKGVSNIQAQVNQDSKNFQATDSSKVEDKQEQKLLYSEIVAKFVDNKINEHRWKPHLVDEHKAHLQLFIIVMGDKPISEINRDIIREYRDTLTKLPLNFTRMEKYKNKTIKEILAMNHKDVLSPVRVNFLVQAIWSLFEWCEAEGIVTFNPVKKLQIKDDRKDIDLRLAFEIRDLVLIFSHPKFADSKFKYPSYFWIPLIGLFTGMRLEEISQLHCSDIYQKNNIWVFDVNEKGVDENGFPKTVKNINAKRLVPIHNELINLGFLDFYNNLRSNNSVRLFPELNKTEKIAKFGKQPGKQFKDVVDSALQVDGFSSDNKSFHSLRHTFADFYKQRGLQTDVFRQLYGHDIPELASRQYGSEFPPEKLKEVINMLDYGIDLTHLYNSKFIKSASL
jgi:integrase